MVEFTIQLVTYKTITIMIDRKSVPVIGAILQQCSIVKDYWIGDDVKDY